MSVPGQQSRVSGDPQHTRGISDPQKPGMSDPQHTRAMKDPQQKQVPGDPQQTPRMGDPQKSQSENNPQSRVSGDPQKSPAESDPKKRVPGSPQFQGFGDPQIRALGDPVLALVRTVARVLLLLVPVYVVGRLGLSVTWLLLGLFLWTFWNRNKKSKLARLRAAWELLDNECLEVTRGLNGQQMPAWVNFPDVERVEWINKIVKQMWPYFGMYMEKLFQEKIEPLVRASNDHMKAFTFTKVNFGEKSPRINGVKVYTKKVDKREVILDLQLCYNGDCEINVEVKKLCKAGVKGLQIHGTLRVILAPLMSDVPFIGAVTFFFIQKPFLDINWTGLTNFLEIPGVNDMSDGMIVDLIASYLVLPNRFTFPLCSQVNAAELRFPVPHGVLRAYLYEAENLIAKDTYLKGLIKGKSDPYAILRVGNQTYKSKTIRENLNPLWNEMYEFVVHEVPGQDLEIDVYDEDPDKDDFLGSLVIGLEGVMKDRVVDEWFPLCDVVSGSVHLKLEWHSLLANPEMLCEASNGMTVAMVIVYLDSAGGLPVIVKARKSPFSEVLRGKSHNTKNHFEYSNNEYSSNGQRYAAYSMSEKEPTSYVAMSIGKKTVKSKTCSTTKDPVWEQAFSFFIQDVHMQHLHLEVKDNNRQCSLGMLDFPLHRILTMDGLTADQRFPLTNSGPNSFIKMKIVLKILQIEDPDPDSVYAGINSLKHGPVSIKRTNQEKPHRKPQSTSDAPQNQVHCIQQSKVTPQQSKVTPQQSKVTPQQSKVTPQQSKAIPQNKVLRRDSSLSSIHRVYQTAPEQNQQANQSAGNSKAPSAPQTPKLRHLQRIAPSLMSLNSMGSSVFDLNEDFSGTGLLLGEINISIRYASLRHCLVVSVNGCRNLIQCSNHGADPYVRIYLLPDRRWASRKKTSVKKKTLHPIYNERFEFLVSLEDVKKRMLDIAVKNNRQFRSHERKEMGKVLVDLSQMDVDQGITDWFELTANGQPTS